MDYNSFIGYANQQLNGDKQMTDFEKTKELAENGNAKAQNNLGLMYHFGKGVEEDYSEAVRWFTKSAEQGDADAQYNLGLMYKKGKGVGADYAEAVRWWEKAAEQGDADAQYMLDTLNKETENKNDWFTTYSNCNLL